MHISTFIVDVFGLEPLNGNPAAVHYLPHGWLPDSTLFAMARENNLPATAFFSPSGSDHASYELRWFSGTRELVFCGHGTLASAYVAFYELGVEAAEITFKTEAGDLLVRKGTGDKRITMNMPTDIFEPNTTHIEIVEDALGSAVEALYSTRRGLMAVLSSDEQLCNLTPNMTKLANIDIPVGLIVTAACSEAGIDCISRYFAPRFGIPEDIATGSAHTAIVPYWSTRLHKNHIRAKQISVSANRQGHMWCQVGGDGRIHIEGTAFIYLTGKVRLQK